MTQKLRYFCTLLLMAVVGVAWAQTTHTIGWGTASGEEGTYTNFTDVSGTVQGILSFSTEKNSAGSNPAYNTNASELRLYYSSQGNGGSITITPADGVTITGAVMTTSTSPSVAYTVDGETATSVSVSNNTYTISDISATSSLKIQNVNTSNTQLRIKTIAITYTTSGNIVATTTTIDASNITNTDVYLGTEAGSLSAVVTETESGDVVAGAPVTWTSSKENVATIDENGVVTLVAAGTTTITASYEGVSGEFGASSATYELTVTSSAPYEQPTEFEIGLNNALFGTEYTGSTSGINDENPVVGTQDNVTVTYAGSGNHYVNDSQIRLYPSNKLTFEAPEGYEIKEIVFTADGTWTATISADGGTYVSDTKTWTGSATSVLFTGSGSGQCRMSKAAITLGLPSTDPTIEASDVNIAYDATSGEIAYTITNPVPGTLLQATADADWVSDITVGDEAITFTTTANELKTERVATFTLTYEGAENKTVTVTQAGNPNIIDKIENISESGVPYNVQGTVVATSARAFVIGDGTGFIYTYLGSAPSWSVGDMVKISGTTSSYNQVIQFPNSATITVATESEYTPLTPAAMTEVPDYTSGLYKSDYYQFEGMLTKEGNYYVVAVGEGQIRISYPSTSQTTELDALLNKMVKVNGFFAGNSANGSGVFTAIMESIEEVVSEDPAVTLANYNISVAAEGGDAILTVQYQNIDDIVPDIQFYEEDGTTETTAAYYEEWLVAELDNDNNVNYVVMDNTGEERKAYFKVFALVGEDYVYSDMITITQEAKEAANVTWNLSIDETATASTTEMSWTSDFATMKVEKAGAGTNTNNYYPGSATPRTSTRFYAGSELTIAPKLGYTITKVEFTATSENYASALINSTWTNATAAVDGTNVTNVTVTPTNGNLAMVATIGGTCGFTGVKVYYEESDVMVIEIKNGFTATTFSCNKALDFTNADVTAQIITDEVGTTQTVTVVPAETGLYITGQPGIHEIPVADASAETDNVDSNKLKAVMEDSNFATQNSVTFYAFGKQKGKEAFYKIPTSGYNVPAGKAVLRITKSNAPEMIVVNGGTTAIDNSQLTIDSLDGEWFDLSGRKLSNGQIQKGIYIVGGRKVVVK